MLLLLNNLFLNKTFTKKTKYKKNGFLNLLKKVFLKTVCFFFKYKNKKYFLNKKNKIIQINFIKV